MGLFRLLFNNINKNLQAYQNTPGAVLLDVRERDEYTAGHIPGSVNLPLSALVGQGSVPYGKNTPLYVYCHSGARSSRAAAVLRSRVYQNVQNIGGIAAYTGEVEV